MATGNMVPYSNPAGHNQTTPSVGATSSSSTQTLPGAATTASSSNPLIPANTAASYTSPLANQLTDIYGATGTVLSKYLDSLSGTNSASLQEYINSLQPQMATAQANTNAALGAGGVGANSSVTALADANLQSQEFSAIAGESAKLTQSQQQETGQVLEDVAPYAAKQTADDNALPWEIMGSVLSAVGGPLGSVAGSMYSQVGQNEAANGTVSSSVPASGSSTSTGGDMSGIMGMFGGSGGSGFLSNLGAGAEGEGLGDALGGGGF